MARTKAEKLAEIHAEALQEFDRIQTAMRDERLQCLQDRRFYSITGAQWEGPLGDQFENKPRFEFNKVHLAVIRIINEYRNNRITVDFIPKDGTTGSDLADVCDGLYRADEQDSGAQEAYDNAFEEAVGGGFGAWRLRTEYEDEEDDEDERQRIRIEPIFDADSSVFFDLDAKRQDKADAKRCFVLSSITRHAYKDEWGDDPASWSKQVYQRQFDWLTPDVVYVAEYYRVEEVPDIVNIYRGLDGQEKRVTDAELQEETDEAEEDGTPSMERTLAATGYTKVREKKVKRRKIHKYILSASKVLEDCGYIAGRCIPIVPVYGKRWFVDNVERCMGHVRLAKDSQRLMNSLLSWLTEIASRFDIEKPILTPEQIVGHASMWADDNINRYPYLLINSLRDADGNPMPSGPIGYTKAPQVPPAMAALIQVAAQSLEDLLGNQQAGEQLQPNQSGKAVELIQNRLDMQVFIYMSNFAKAMKRSGEIWLSMARDAMPEDGRKMKTLSSDGEPDTVTLKQPAIDEESGAQVMKNDLDDAKFDVWTDVGPSSSSRRAATVRALTGMAQITDDPQTRSVLTGAAMMNIEGEGLTDVRDFFRSRMVKMGVTKPTKEEQAELQADAQNQQPDAQQQYLLAAAEQAKADAAQSRAKTVDTIAAADLKHAQTAKLLAEADGTQQSQQIASIGALKQILDLKQQAAEMQQPAQGQMPQSPPAMA